MYSSVVLVPCPGADPHATWTRDPLPDGVFETYPAQFPEMGPTQATTGAVPSRARPSWVARGIRKEAAIARILAYKHRKISNNLTLKNLADDLLRLLFKERGSQVGLWPPMSPYLPLTRRSLASSPLAPFFSFVTVLAAWL
jgi:hypothetical protein